MSVTIDPILRHFDYQALPLSQHAVARLYQQFAINLVMLLPESPEKKVAIRWLLHAKDMTVHAVSVREAPYSAKAVA
jgi:hypothetical protein